MSPYRTTSTYKMGHVPRAQDIPRADSLSIHQSRRPLILRVALAVIFLATLAAFLLPRQYTSSAVVMLDQHPNTVTDLSAVLSQRDPATLQNQIQILTSRELASEVITRLQLYNDPEFNPVLVPQGPAGMMRLNFWFPDSGSGDMALTHDRILAAFLSHVSAEANGLSTAITVYATAKDPRKAQDIANTLTRVYVEDQVSAKRNANQATSDWLDKRTGDLAQQLMLEQQAVQQYKTQHGLNDSAPGNSLLDQQMAAINAQIVQARSELAEKQAASGRVGAAAMAGNAADVSQVVASPLIVQLRGQQADLIRHDADLSSKYGPLHPKILAVQAQERDLNAKIAQEVTRIAGSLHSDVSAARAHLNSLEQSLSQMKLQANSENLARVELQALQSNVDSTKAQYEAFVGRLRVTEDQDTAAAPESRIISSASLPLAPSGPRRALIVGASIPMGFLLGILAALMSERLSSGLPVPVKPARQMPNVHPAVWDGPPILAELANAEKMRAAAYVVDFPGSRYAAAMSALVGQLESHEGGASVVAVTSAQGGESKSVVAVSLARAAAQMGRKTVLIDCDPGQLASSAMHAPARAGLYEVLTGKVPLSKALAKDCRSGVYALAMTRRPPRLSTMFASAAMTRLLQILRESADLVVLDCSHVGSPEASLLARLGDATLVVTRKDMLGKLALSQTLAALTGVAPLAIVATR
ncbi:MAG TPA: exopolysaccharide transport family protein [Rhizomicrobium sp.]|nr:exopolysaccharide transport family protein [Rhizomicrobium sp.]